MPFGELKSILYAREMSLPEFLALSWVLFKQIYPLLMLIGIILLFPVFLLQALFPELLTSVAAIMNLTEAIAATVFTLGAFYVVQSALHQQETTISEAFAFGFSRLGKALWTLALYTVIVAVLTIFILPGIIFGIYNNFALLVVAQDGIWGYPALKRSKRLVEGRWWRVFTLLAFTFVATVGLTVSAAYLFTALHPTSALVLIIDLIGLVLLSFFTVCRMVLYVNLRANPLPPEDF